MSKRILIVDDEPQVRASLARMLDGCAVTLVDSGAEAIAAVRRGERFELILCDVLMPQMSGLAMRAGLAEHDATLADRLVFMTGGVDQRVDALGITPVLRKPFSSAELSRFVTAQLDRIAA